MNPHSHAPTHPPKYTLYCDKDGKDLILCFRKAYGAAKCIDLLLEEGEEYDYIDEDMLLTTSGVTIRCTHLTELMDYQYKGDEHLWEPEKMFQQNIHYLLYGQPDEKKNQEINRSVTKKKRSLPKYAETDYKGVPDLARAIKKTPQKTRQLLRKIMSKPEYGWKFKNDEFNDIVNKLQGQS